MSGGRLAIFAYGSLVSRTSIAETLGREPRELIAARLHGWTRDWSLARDNLRSEKRFARADGTLPRFCLALNLVAEAAAAPNGALIELSPSELERLDRREIRYRRVEVGETVEAAEPHRFDRVFAYVAKAEHHHPVPPPGSVILRAYPEAVEAAFAALGDGQLELYRETTAAQPTEPIEAELIAERIPPGNPRRW